ncbi:MAG: hypothetical protein JWM33_2958 [Caulobacteraceae bacterium]|nr:hypothetical protein [Caulobacteraceae bacterium]
MKPLILWVVKKGGEVVATVTSLIESFFVHPWPVFLKPADRR